MLAEEEPIMCSLPLCTQEAHCGLVIWDLAVCPWCIKEAVDEVAENKNDDEIKAATNHSKCIRCGCESERGLVIDGLFICLLCAIDSVLHLSAKKEAQLMEEQGYGDAFDNEEEALAAAESLYASALTKDGVYFVPHGNESDEEGNPKPGSLDWCLENEWSLVGEEGGD